MKREAAVPIDEELEAAIGEQQRRVLDRWPDGAPLLFPRQRANVSGNVPLDRRHLPQNAEPLARQSARSATNTADRSI